MLHLGLPDGNCDARRTATGILAPSVLPEQAQRLSYGFVETLRGDLDSMLDAAARRSSSALQVRIVTERTLALSLFIRQQVILAVMQLRPESGLTLAGRPIVSA